jgi:Ni,Fe-hydrogenase I cytochrome b subunit
MITDSFFTFACAGVIGILFGIFLTVAGYRFFLYLLPVWGFFFSLVLGAQATQVLLPGNGFLATVTSWVVGFVVGAIFAVLSYLFYAFAVAIISGSLGYFLAVGVMGALGMNYGLITLTIAILVAIVAAFVTIWFNLQKWVVIIATSVLGAATIFGTILLLFNPVAALLENPVRVFLNSSTFLFILFLLVAGLGIYVQFATTRTIEVEAYNRIKEPTSV